MDINIGQVLDRRINYDQSWYIQWVFQQAVWEHIHSYEQSAQKIGLWMAMTIACSVISSSKNSTIWDSKVIKPGACPPSHLILLAGSRISVGFPTSLPLWSSQLPQSLLKNPQLIEDFNMIIFNSPQMILQWIWDINNQQGFSIPNHTSSAGKVAVRGATGRIAPNHGVSHLHSKPGFMVSTPLKHIFSTHQKLPKTVMDGNGW